MSLSSAEPNRASYFHLETILDSISLVLLSWSSLAIIHKRNLKRDRHKWLAMCACWNGSERITKMCSYKIENGIGIYRRPKPWSTMLRAYLLDTSWACLLRAKAPSSWTAQSLLLAASLAPSPRRLSLSSKRRSCCCTAQKESCRLTSATTDESCAALDIRLPRRPVQSISPFISCPDGFNFAKIATATSFFCRLRA